MKTETIDLSQCAVAEKKENAGFTMQSIIEKANVEFLSLSRNVSLSFPHFAKMIKERNIDKILKNQDAGNNETHITIPSDLLVEISHTEIQKKEATKNLLSGVFLLGMLMGCTMSIFGILIVMSTHVTVTRSLLAYTGMGFLMALLIIVGVPMLLAAVEPSLKKIQEKHHEFMDRLMHLFQ